MKILLVHNFYGSSAPSGENTAFLAEAELLRQHGHTVIEFTRYSDEIRRQGAFGAVLGALSTPWNLFTLRELRAMIRRERPDVMHVHNTFPIISPAVLHAVGSSGTATVMTLHNYRIFCAAAIPLRNGQPCSECLDKKAVLPALRYGCYRRSRLATLPLAANIALHRAIGTWSDKVDAFIVLTEFQRQKVVKAGLPGDSVFVKPPCYPRPPSLLPWNNRERKAVFIGRIGPEKGLRFLIDAWMKWGDDAPVLEVIGAGQEKQAFKNKAAAGRLNGKIQFAGQLPFERVQASLSQAQLLVLPSVSYEGFPMVILEAFALGVPVAASRIGSLPFIVDDRKDGVLFDPGMPDELLHAVRTLWEDGRALEEAGRAAREKFEREYSSAANCDTLMHIYDLAISSHRKRA
jgi:glycosyltransferase involved in cell wall biosynthesis